jgi:hypothetical protein
MGKDNIKCEKHSILQGKIRLNERKLHSLQIQYQFKTEGFHTDLNRKEKLELQITIGKY